MMQTIKPLQPGDTVEDRRIKKIWPKPGDTERYSGCFGEVVEVSETGFQVQWADCEESRSYKMGYGWGFFGEAQIAKASGVIIQ